MVWCDQEVNKRLEVFFFAAADVRLNPKNSAKTTDLSENDRGSCGWRRAETLDDAQRE